MANNKFILFAYDRYYPSGGLSDIKGDFKTLGQALAAAAKNDADYKEIVDRDTWEPVWANFER